MPDRDNENGSAATVEADLAAIEAALDAGHTTSVDERERAFQQLALALEADAPKPRSEFERELGERMRAGFPRITHSRLQGAQVGDKWRFRGTPVRLRGSLSGFAGRVGRL